MMINQLNGDRGIVAGGGISGFWFLVSGFLVSGFWFLGFWVSEFLVSGFWVSGFWLARLGGIYPAD